MKVKVLNAQTQLEIREIDLPETMAQHGECSLGRSPNSALVLDSPDVSRLHGKFRLEQGQYFFYDLGSANGSTVNGQLAQANHGYVLKSGDIVRVGEFVLLLHEFSLEDLPATVIGDPNATVIGRFQPESINNPSVSSPIQEELSRLLELIELENIAAVDSVSEEILPEIVHEPLATEVSEEELSEDSVEPAPLTTEAIAEEPETPTDEVAQIKDELAAESMLAEAGTYLQLTDTDSTTIQLSEPTSDEVFPEAIDVEPDLIDAMSIKVSDEMIEEAIATEIPALDQLPDSESVEAVTEDALEVDPWDEPLPTTDSEEVSEAATVLQISEPLELSESLVSEPLELSGSLEGVSEDETVLQIIEPLEQSEEQLTEPIAEESTVIQDSEPLEQPEIIEEVLEDRTALQLSEQDSLIEPIAEEPTVIQDSKLLEQPLSAIAFPSEVEPAIGEPARDEIEAPMVQPVIEEPAIETPVAEKPTIVTTKYIALLANDSQIAELEQLIERHQDLLKQCKTIATPTISEALRRSSGLSISQQTPAVSSGGYQTINSLITSEQILAVIFLRDFLAPQPTQVNDDALSRSCNVYQVLFATNAPTADALLHYIKTVVATQ